MLKTQVLLILLIRAGPSLMHSQPHNSISFVSAHKARHSFGSVSTDNQTQFIKGQAWSTLDLTHAPSFENLEKSKTMGQRLKTLKTWPVPVPNHGLGCGCIWAPIERPVMPWEG